jgi:hypothetical protein
VALVAVTYRLAVDLSPRPAQEATVPLLKLYSVAQLMKVHMKTELIFETELILN